MRHRHVVTLDAAEVRACVLAAAGLPWAVCQSNPDRKTEVQVEIEDGGASISWVEAE